MAAGVFKNARTALYCSILVFSIICLAMSVQFQRLLSSSDLTRFVPFSIFVCTISIFIFLILLLSGILLRERSPISSRIELACLGLLGVFWLALGGFLASSEAGSADVECYASETSQVPLEDSLASFHTEQFQAMYRVLTAFSLLNAVLVLLCFFVLLYMLWRRHQLGDKHMWYVPVTAGVWPHAYASKTPQRHHSKKSSSGGNNRWSILPVVTPREKVKEPRAAVYLTEKPQRHGPRRAREAGGSQRWGTDTILDGGMRNPTKIPERPRR